MSQTIPIAEAKNVSFTYVPENKDVRFALQDVSFHVQRGDWVAIVGHNGSGKSTLAQLMIGLLLPISGEMKLFGSIYTEENVWDIRARLGIVFQNPDNQFVGATVQDDVAFALENRGVPHEEMVRRVEEALRVVNMDQFLTAEPHHLSGGQKQRVAIAGAIAQHPELLILDEATSMLDPQGRAEVIQTVKALRDTIDLTVLSITHDLEEVLLADHVIVMNEGRCLMTGTPEEIFANGMELETIGLDLPFALKMAQLLEQQGLPLQEQVMTEEELVNALWTYHSSV